MTAAAADRIATLASRPFPHGGAILGRRGARHASQIGRGALEAIERLEAITIARLHGHVIGGGLVLTLGCDFRIAAGDTQFHIPEVDLGIPLTWGAVPRLIRVVGAARARELILLCDRFDADVAAQHGLLNRVVPPDQLDVQIDEWATRLAAKAPWALHTTKSQFRAYDHSTLLGDVTHMDGDLLTAATTEDPTRFVFTPR